MTRLYYTTPEHDVFNEVKNKAIDVWIEMYPEDNHPFYAKEKVDRIKDMGNVSDNLMYIVAMFDLENQLILANRLSDNSRKAIRERMIDGGNQPELIVF